MARKKIGVLHVLGWIVGISMFLVSVTSLFSGQLIAAIFVLLAGLVIFPPFMKWFESKVNIELTTWLRIILFFVFLILISLVPHTDETNSSEEISSQINNLETSQSLEIENMEICEEEWECSEWSECTLESKKTRTCISVNNCIGETEPTTTKTCVPSYEIGDIINAGDFNIKINNIYYDDQIGENYYGYFMGAEANGEFIILDLEVENVGDSAKYFSDTMIKLIDKNGREFSADSTAGYYYNSDYRFNFYNINPGITIEGGIVFDIPVDADLVSIGVYDSYASSSYSTFKMFF